MCNIHEVPSSSRIQLLNDRFRTKWIGNGSLVITVGVKNQGELFVREAIRAVHEFHTFTPDNDPWHEHDFGSVELSGEKIFWKIDYYNLDLSAGSEDPADETRTHRVLTIMLASEY
ncbi:MAG: DUF3768 domain-containing protein [Candidatus Thiodiazotropha sp.]